MGLYLKFVDLNKAFNVLKNTPLIINVILPTSKENKQKNKDITTIYNENDVLNNIPECGCGNLKYTYNLGLRCDICGEVVKEVFDDAIEPKIWFKKPNGILSLVNPQYWGMLKNIFSVKQFCFIDYLTNREYKEHISEDIKINLEKLHSLGIERGYNFFIQNMEFIITSLYALPRFKIKRGKGSKGELLELYDKFKHILYIDAIPILNKTLLIVESTEKGVLVDPTIHGVLDAIETMKGIDSELNSFSLAKKENRTSKILSTLSNFYSDAHDKILAKKGGLFRKHCLGTRCHFSIRGVITPIVIDHKYDEIHIPWTFACVMLKIHIANKLYKLDYTPNEINELIDSATNRYDPLIHKIFLDLIEESPYKGIPGFFVRNPSLTSSSVQLMRITKIKIDLNDKTISLSPLACKAYNADFDGDEMSFVMTIDNKHTEQLAGLRSHLNMLDVNKYRALSNVASLPKPTASSIDNWLSQKEEDFFIHEDLLEILQ